MTDDIEEADPSVPIICPECDTESAVALSELADSISRHNEQRHDGEDVATVDPELAAEIQDLAAKDLGLL